MESVYLHFFILVVCQQKQVLAFGLSVGKDQTINFTLAGFFRRNVIRHLNALKYSVAITHDKVTFSRTVVEIIDIPAFVFTLAYQVEQYYGLKAPS